MSDNLLQSVDRAGFDLQNRVSRSGFASAEQVESSKAKKTDQQQPVQSGKSGESQGLSIGSLSNISLQFKIDSKTNVITVLILDKASRKVIRTIPPDELADLRQGDLVELFG